MKPRAATRENFNLQQPRKEKAMSTNMATGTYLDPFDTQITAEEIEFRHGYEDRLDEIGYANKLHAQAVKLQETIEREHDEHFSIERIEKALHFWLETEIENLIEDAAAALPFHRASGASTFFGALNRRAA